MVRARQFFNILILKYAPHYSGVQFLRRCRCFVHFDLKMYFSLQRRAIFPHRKFKRMLRFAHFDLKCASRYSGVHFFMSSLNSHLRARRFTEVTFRPSRPTNHWKTHHFAPVDLLSTDFRAIISSFFWLYFFSLLFHLLTLLLCSACLTVHIIGN